jgi:hypothetical protein
VRQRHSEGHFQSEACSIAPVVQESLERHFFNPNPLGRYSLGTKNKNLSYNTDGSLTLYACAKSPGKDKEPNWLPAPKRHVLPLPSRVLGRQGHPGRPMDAPVVRQVR